MNPLDIALQLAGNVQKDRFEGDKYIFHDYMFSQTPLQNYLEMTDSRKMNEMNGRLSQPLMSKLIEEGIISTLAKGVESEDTEFVNDSISDRIQFRASVSFVEEDDRKHTFRFTKKYKATKVNGSIINDRTMHEDNFIAKIMIAAVIDTSGSSHRSPMLHLIYEAYGNMTSETIAIPSFSYDRFKDILVTKAHALADSLDTGTMPEICDDLWPLASGVPSRCKNYCSVADICPHYESTFIPSLMDDDKEHIENMIVEMNEPIISETYTSVAQPFGISSDALRAMQSQSIIEPSLDRYDFFRDQMEDRLHRSAEAMRYNAPFPRLETESIGGIDIDVVQNPYADESVMTRTSIDENGMPVTEVISRPEYERVLGINSDGDTEDDAVAIEEAPVQITGFTAAVTIGDTVEEDAIATEIEPIVETTNSDDTF